jgi:hypothetical protein
VSVTPDQIPSLDDHAAVAGMGVDPNAPDNAGQTFGAAKPKKDAEPKKHQKILRRQVMASDRLREKRNSDYQKNVNYRIGKPFDTDPERDEIVVNADWSRTKDKTAKLAVQIPKMTLEARAPQWEDPRPMVQSVINFELQHEIKAHVTIEECLADIINAAGFGAYHISYEAGFVSKDVPAVDVEARTSVDDILALAKQYPEGVPTTPVKTPVYQKIDWNRISPRDFLSPVDFKGSNWGKAPWLGYKDRLPRVELERRAWITAEDDLEVTTAQTDRTVNETNEDGDHDLAESLVEFLVVYYRPHLFRADKSDCRELWRIIWVTGKDEPVKDEPFASQVYSSKTNEWVGVTTFPIKPCTLTYISDESLPPSDSEMGRPQVRELNRSRSQMLQQRDRSLPLRWADVTTVDEEVLAQLRLGVIQDFIPTQGPGGNSFGEIARANYPRESFEFMRIYAGDLDESWSSGSNQMGFNAPGDQTAEEARIVQGNASVSLEHQRAKVLAWILEGAETTLDFMQVHYTLPKYVPFAPPGSEQKLARWTQQDVPGKYLFSARPDGAVRIDANQKKVESLNLYKLVRRDELVDPRPLLSDVFETHVKDPAQMVPPPKPPEPPPPMKPPTLSFKGEDMANPLAVALLLKTTGVMPEDIQAARMLMAECGIPVPPTLTVPDKPAPPPPPGAPPAGGPPQENGQSAPHLGLPEQVQPIDQRYERNPEANAQSADNQL